MLEPGGDDDRRDRDAALRREATRLLWRYVVEVVEAFDLCPWARRAREQGEVRVEVVTATGGDAARDASVAAAVERIAGDPDAVMGMVVLARDPVTPLALRRLRDAVLTTSLARVVAIADFHPAAAQDLGTAARAVPWLRRSPDPTLQVVRLAAMASLRGAAAPARATQAAILAGHARARAAAADLGAGRRAQPRDRARPRRGGRGRGRGDPRRSRPRLRGDRRGPGCGAPVTPTASCR
ncbi:MAG: DUF1415 family protein [Kofleriaceae bacterium]|nr:DUF1415 family protein [Kofleriaceae bacterium]